MRCLVTSRAVGMGDCDQDGWSEFGRQQADTIEPGANTMQWSGTASVAHDSGSNVAVGDAVWPVVVSAANDVSEEVLDILNKVYAM